MISAVTAAECVNAARTAAASLAPGAVFLDLNSVSPKTKLVFLANPNNPTGVYANKAQFGRFLQALPERVVLVLDEAYFEYVRAQDYPDGVSYIRMGRQRLIARQVVSRTVTRRRNAGVFANPATVHSATHRRAIKGVRARDCIGGAYRSCAP